MHIFTYTYENVYIQKWILQYPSLKKKYSVVMRVATLALPPCEDIKRLIIDEPGSVLTIHQNCWGLDLGFPASTTRRDRPKEIEDQAKGGLPSNIGYKF